MYMTGIPDLLAAKGLSQKEVGKYPIAHNPYLELCGGVKVLVFIKEIFAENPFFIHLSADFVKKSIPHLEFVIPN